MKISRYITALLLIISICFGLCLIFASGQLEKAETLSKDNNSLKTKLDGLSLQISNSKKEITSLTQQLNELQRDQKEQQDQLDNKIDLPDRGGERWTERTMHCTAYWAGSCGKDPDDPAYGITASGKMVQDGMIAAYWPELPQGTRVYIPVLDKVFVVEDTGGAIGKGDLDIYMTDRKTCMAFGVQDLKVYTLDEE